MKQFKTMAYPYIIWMSAMIVLPMFLIVLYAFTTKGNNVATFKFTLMNFAKFFSDQIFINVMLLSIKIAVITTVICVFLGYPAAYIIANSKEKSRAYLVLLITLPMWINMLVRTYAWMGILQDDGIINSLLMFFGINGVKLLHTDFAVVLGMVYNFIPFMILQIYTSLTKMDKSYIEAASDLGANKLHCFLRITLPLSLPGVISGITLVFLPAVSSFFIPKLLGGGQYVLIGTVIESQFLTSGNWNFGSALSLIMAVIIMISMYITKKIDRSEEPVKVEGGRPA
ncbi:MAG: ABC transporter permease [Lachnospiraceae bacterium]|nr:ABC transporter permease [Lachnospiraceae bacterium]